MAYLMPSAFQTTSAYCPALGWKSQPHDGLPGEEYFFSRRAYQIRDCGSIPCFWKLRAKKLSSPPRLLLVPFFPWLDFLQACLHSLPVVPAPPQPLPNPVPHNFLVALGEAEGGFPLPSMYPALPIDF